MKVRGLICSGIIDHCQASPFPIITDPADGQKSRVCVMDFYEFRNFLINKLLALVIGHYIPQLPFKCDKGLLYPSVELSNSV